MAVSINTVYEVRTAGNDSNGGGFVTGAAGTDYSQQDTKNTVGADISTVDAVGAGTTTITSATANFGASIVGNIICLSGGTGALAIGWYQVTARASTLSITVDRIVATGTGITMDIGGALASPGGLGRLGSLGLVSGNIAYFKAGTYSITSATINIPGGCFSTTTSAIQMEGYQTTRGDLGTKPLFQASAIATFTMINFAINAPHKIVNLKLDGASLTTSAGISFRSLAFKCEFVNFTNRAIASNSNITGTAIQCSASGCSTLSAFNNVDCIDCVAFNNTATGFSSTELNHFIRCISDSNTGALTDGFSSASTVQQISLFTNCVAYGNGRDGFRISATRGQVLTNCIAESNVRIGFNIVNVGGIQLSNCAAFGNGTNFSMGTGVFVINYNPITGTSTFFTDALNQNFSLNNTAGGGASARAGGIPGVFPQIPTTGFIDIGAAQHADSGGGSSVFSAAYVG